MLRAVRRVADCSSAQSGLCRRVALKVKFFRHLDVLLISGWEHSRVRVVCRLQVLDLNVFIA